MASIADRFTDVRAGGTLMRYCVSSIYRA